MALKVFAMKNDPRRTFSELADIKALLELTSVDKETVKRYFEKWGLLNRYYEIVKKGKRNSILTGICQYQKRISNSWANPGTEKI